MDEEKQAAKLEAEKLAAEEKAKNNPEDTTNGAEGDDKTPAGVAKKDYSQMSEEDIMADLKEKHKEATPEQLLSEMAKQMKIISHKNRAIDSLKKETKPANTVEKKPEEDLDKPITRRELIELNNKKTIEALAEKSVQDPKEREAILKAYNEDIIKTGDISLDFKKAFAIANIGVVEDYKKNQSISRDNENYVSQFSGGNTYGGSFNASAPNDAVKRATADNLRKAGYSQTEIDSALAKL